MPKIFPLMETLFQNKGSNPQLWTTIKETLTDNPQECHLFCSLMKNRINYFDKEICILALNLLDYAVDNCKKYLIEEVDTKDFLSVFVNVLKTREEIDLQDQVLYLIQKWANKFKNISLSNCLYMYNVLKKNDIEFPNNVSKTYKDYIKNKEYFEKDEGYTGNKKLKEFEKKNEKSKKIIEPENYIKSINLDLKTSSYEKKYKRLVNKLYDWTHSIEEINELINNNQNKNNNFKIKTLCEELKQGKDQLSGTINGGKLKDNTLMHISVCVVDDMNTTLDRWNKSKDGNDPGPFMTSFLEGDSNDNNKGNNVNLLDLSFFNNNNQNNNMNNQNNFNNNNQNNFNNFNNNNQNNFNNNQNNFNNNMNNQNNFNNFNNNNNQNNFNNNNDMNNQNNFNNNNDMNNQNNFNNNNDMNNQNNFNNNNDMNNQNKFNNSSVNNNYPSFSELDINTNNNNNNFSGNNNYNNQMNNNGQNNNFCGGNENNNNNNNNNNNDENNDDDDFGF